MADPTGPEPALALVIARNGCTAELWDDVDYQWALLCDSQGKPAATWSEMTGETKMLAVPETHSLPLGGRPATGGPSGESAS